jgi:hypothetical protein
MKWLTVLAFEVLGYILLLKGCVRCWSAGFSRWKWKARISPKAREDLQRTARTVVET